jgi:hypothetical protein
MRAQRVVYYVANTSVEEDLPWGFKDEGIFSNTEFLIMGYKPSCPRCGGVRRRCRVKRAYYCRRCGYLPSGRHLNSMGEVRPARRDVGQRVEETAAIWAIEDEVDWIAQVPEHD